MYVINRNLDTDDGGVATLQTDAAAFTDLTPEDAKADSTDDGNQAAAENELEDDDFKFADESGNEDSRSPSSPAAPTEVTIPKSQHDKVVAELEALKSDFAKLQTAFETNPMVKAAIEYQSGLEAGVDLNPSDFLESYFGVDASRLDVEALISLQIREEAAQIGAKLTDDTFERTLTSRMVKYEDMDELEKEVFAKRLRDSRAQVSKEKQDKLINDRKADIEKGQLFWKDAYENGIQPVIQKMLAEGKKEIGLKGEVSKDEVERIGVSLSNNFYRFTKDGKLNIPHAVEVAQFSSDIPGYIRRIEDRAIARHEATKLKTGSVRNAGSPSAPGLLDREKSKISTKPLTNLLDGADVLV